MKLCRYRLLSSDQISFGLLEGNAVSPVAREEVFTTRNVPAPTGEPVPLSAVKLLAPTEPSKIVCVGRNYRDHAAELGNPMPPEPLLFLKAPSAVVAHEEEIVLPRVSANVQHEGELAVVIGRRARRLADSENPLDYVLGYTCLNDVTARDLQQRDVQFTRAKSFDTFCPVGPYVVSDVDPLDLHVETRVNGAVRQRGRTSMMAFSVPYLVRYVSHAMTLEPGDILSTGTPAGVGPLLAGDTVEVEVEGVGTLRNFVRAAGEELAHQHF